MAYTVPQDQEQDGRRRKQYTLTERGEDALTPVGPRQTLEAGIDHVKTAILSWERIAREARKRTGHPSRVIR